MVDENLRVWLIEVNSSPSMNTKNQPVLQHLCKSVLHDLAKIVIDMKKNKNCDKGGFEIVHRAKNEVQRPRNNMTIELKCEGQKIVPNPEKYLTQSNYSRATSNPKSNIGSFSQQS